MTVAGDENADPDSVKQRKDVYLINALNSYNVAMRMKSYFCASRSVSLDFVVQDDEKPGDPVRFTDPHGTPSVGYLESTVNKASSFIRAKSAINVGYAPEYWGNSYHYCRLLIDNGVWTVPEDMDGQTVRVALIGGGSGGSSGQRGTDKQITESDGRQQIIGGGGGIGGDGGKIYVTEIIVRAGEQYAFQIGAGGAGGAASSEFEKVYQNPDDPESGYSYQYTRTPGEPGAATTFVGGNINFTNE